MTPDQTAATLRQQHPGKSILTEPDLAAIRDRCRKVALPNGSVPQSYYDRQALLDDLDDLRWRYALLVEAQSVFAGTLLTPGGIQRVQLKYAEAMALCAESLNTTVAELEGRP